MMTHIWLLLLMFLPGVASLRLVTASTGSCLQIPCQILRQRSFHKLAKWLKKDETAEKLVIDSNGQSDDSFQKRTKLHAGWKEDGVCTLTIQNLKDQDAGYYYFTLGHWWSMSNNKNNGFLLNISSVPIFPIISSPGEIRAGKEIKLYCSARYICPNTLSWEIPGMDSKALETNKYNDTTSVSVTLVPSPTDHGKKCSCMHSRDQGQPLKQSVTLNVLYAPTFAYVTISHFEEMNFRKSVTLRCGVGDSNPPVTEFRWNESSSWRKSDSFTLEVEQTRGQKWCEAKNSIGTIRSNATKFSFYENSRWAVWTPLSLRARLGSCVVIPCRFRIPNSHMTQMKGIWRKGHHFHGQEVISNSIYTGLSGVHEKRAIFLGNLENRDCSLKIQDVRTVDALTYYFRMETAIGSWSDQIGLQLIVSRRSETPEITVPDKIVLGKKVSLTCTVGSHCPEDTAELEWDHPDIHREPTISTGIRGNYWVHRSTVSLSPTFQNRQKKVRCSARFGSGTDTTEREVALDVKYPPRNATISMRTDLMYFAPGLSEGDTIALTCTFEAANPSSCTYGWFRDDQKVQDTTKVLLFQSLSFTDYGKYTCEVFNSEGSTRSKEFPVTGKYRPKEVHIKGNIKGQEHINQVTVWEGEKLTLTCLSKRSEPPISHYTWYWDNKWRWGEKSMVLTVTQQDQGKYCCEATNKVGVGRSPTFTVNVYYRPKEVHIKGNIKGQEHINQVTVWEGEKLTLTCLSKRSEPPISHYTWYWDNKWRWGEKSMVLTVTQQDQGKYCCEATNKVGVGRSPTFTVNVYYKPKNVDIKSSVKGLMLGEPVTVQEGQTLVLVCMSEWSQPPVSNYTWYQNGTKRWTNETVVQKVTRQHSGRYQCEATNLVGKGVSPNLTINVQYPPTNVRIIGPSEVRVGQTVTFICHCEANPVCVSYTWSRLCGSHVTTLSPRTWEYDLRVSMSDLYCQYRCRGTSSIGELDSFLLPLNVQYSPTNVSVRAPSEAVEGERVVLACLSSGNPPAISYQWRKRCGERDERLEGTTSEIQVTLSQDGRCGYSCSAENMLGFGESPSKHITIKWNSQRKVLVSVTPTVIFLGILGALGIFCIIKKKRGQAADEWNSDAINVVYSVVNKPTKTRERTVYENMVLMDNAQPQEPNTPSCWDPIHESVQFQPMDGVETHRELYSGSDIAGQQKVNTRHPSVVYSQVCVRPHAAKAHCTGPLTVNLNSEDYENIGHLESVSDTESEEEIRYATVVFPQQSTSGPHCSVSQESVEYGNLRF